MSRTEIINARIEELERELRWYQHLAEENESKWSPKVAQINNRIWELEDELYEISEESEAFWNDMD